MKEVISIKYGWSTIAWEKILHLGHQVQNFFGVKIHKNCKVLSKFCQHFKGTKTHMGKLFGIYIFLSEKSRLYRYYQNKNQIGFTSSSHINLAMKLCIKS